MKSGFSKSVTYVPAFAGNREAPVEQQLRAELSPLNVYDLIALTEVAQSQQGSQNQAEIAKTLLTSCRDILPRYVKLHGAEDFTIEDVVNYFRFVDLAVELFGELQSISSPNETERKN